MRAKLQPKYEDLWLEKDVITTKTILEITRCATLLICHECATDYGHAVEMALSIMRTAKDKVLEAAK